MRRMLCVGGRSDGRYQTVEDDRRDCVVFDPVSHPHPWSITWTPVTSVPSPTRTHYVSLVLRGEDRTFAVLVPEGTSAATTIERLIDGYYNRPERTP